MAQAPGSMIVAGNETGTQWKLHDRELSWKKVVIMALRSPQPCCSRHSTQGLHQKPQ